MIDIPSNLYAYKGLHNLKTFTYNCLDFENDDLSDIDEFDDDNIDEKTEQMVQSCRYYKRANLPNDLEIINPVILFEIYNEEGKDFEEVSQVKDFYSEFLKRNNFTEDDIDTELLDLLLCPLVDCQKMCLESVVTLTQVNTIPPKVCFLVDEIYKENVDSFCIMLVYKGKIVALSEQLKIDPKNFIYMDKILSQHHRC